MILKVLVKIGSNEHTKINSDRRFTKIILSSKKVLDICFENIKIKTDRIEVVKNLKIVKLEKALANSSLLYIDAYRLKADGKPKPVNGIVKLFVVKINPHRP